MRGILIALASLIAIVIICLILLMYKYRCDPTLTVSKCPTGKSCQSKYLGFYCMSDPPAPTPP